MTTNLAFASIKGARTGDVTRTFSARLGDVFNVRDFGATGLGTPNDDRPFIQAAINAAVAAGGGTVFFPAGKYYITAKLVIPGDSVAHMSLIGVGSDPFDGFFGSCINGNFADYLLYVSHPIAGGQNISKHPWKTIQGLGFNNSHDIGAVLTSAESPSPPEGTTAGNGYGAIYLGYLQVCSIINCDIAVVGGIGIAGGSGLGLYVQSTQISGGYIDAGKNLSTYLSGIGILSSSLTFADSKISRFAIGVELIHGVSKVTNCDIEVCGVGMKLGYLDVALWGATDGATLAPAGIFGTQNVILDDIVFESCQFFTIWCYNVAWSSFRALGIGANGQLGTQSSGINANGARHCTFQDIAFSGGYSYAALQLDGAGNSHGSNTFINLDFSAVGSGTHVSMPPNSGDYWTAGDPDLFINCQGFDGGVTYAARPIANTNGNYPIVITDANETAYGAPITSGGGSKRVLARYDLSTTTWVVAGGPPLAVSFASTGLPSGPVLGQRSILTDSSSATPTFGATITGGGTAKVPVYYDGSVWRYG